MCRHTIIFVLLCLFLVSGSLYAESVLDKESLSHIPGNVCFSYLTQTGEANLKLQVQRDGVEEVYLVFTTTEQEVLMNFYAVNSFYTYYVHTFKPVDQEINYLFKVIAGEEVLYYGANGAMETFAATKPFNYFLISMQTFATPEWAKGAVFYQIFPERFNNGDQSNDPGSEEWEVYGRKIETHKWDELPTNPGLGADFFGGDLQGIIEKLDYLADLGIQAIYLNPVHEGISNHKYDASDYLQIDAHFGTNELFAQLVAEAKKRGIYIVIDGVFNHTGTEFWAFRDIREKAELSPYVQWYNIYSFPVDLSVGNYKKWNGYASLPALNFDYPDVRKYILHVVQFWMSLGVKGIRLDAPKEVPHDFWQELYQMAKELDPEFLIIGEVWDDASLWINQREFDSTMNYLYRDLLIRYFIQRTKRPGTFVRELGMDQTRYPEPANMVLYNMVSTHDVERFMTLAKGNLAKIKPMVIFQFTYLGAPAIYYGEEIGMEGGQDPDCRRPMIWDQSKWNQELYQCYKQMIHIRRRLPALQRGSFKLLQTDDTRKILIFAREYEGERVISVLNNGDLDYPWVIPFAEWGITGEVEDVLNGGVYNSEKADVLIKSNWGAVFLVN